MVFVVDDGGVFDAPLEEVWRFVSSPEAHSGAHRHRGTARRRLSENVGEYSWEQPFDGGTARFTMRWTAFVPLGVAYEVLEGPFAGSRFFLYYTPRGARTAVTVVGEFVSSTIPLDRLEAVVRRFFATEYEQDRDGIAAMTAAGPS